MSTNGSSTPPDPTDAAPTPSSSTAPSSSSSSPSQTDSSTNSSPTSADPTTQDSTTSTSTETPTTSSSSSDPTTTPSETPTPSTSTSETPTPSTSSSSTFSTSTTPSSTPSSTTPTSTFSTPQPTTLTSVSTHTDGGTTSVIVITSTQQPQTTSTPTTTSSKTSSTGPSGTPGLQTGQKSSSGGLSQGGTIAVAVVVPIVAVALLVLAGLFLWRKRKARKDAEDLRRKEVEEYGYNPNNDPTLPAVGSASGNEQYEMREDGSSGYRGWGTTAVGSTGRKASTTISGGQSAAGIGMAYSEGTSPTHGPTSDTRSDNPLMDGRPLSGEQESLGAMGPAAADNRSGGINRGPSNASSSYSAGNRSDGSGDLNGMGGAYYNNQYDTGNPYTETGYGSPPGRAEMSGQPVIRDVQARRNTRIENPSHFPQQSAGISQNF